MSISFTTANEKNIYELTELARMFGEAPQFCVLENESVDSTSKEVRNKEKRQLYHLLADKTGISLDWGILTGVRPLKLYKELAAKNGRERAEEILKGDYLLSDGKLQLLRETSDVQDEVKIDKNPKAVSLYIGIPFCPTRCLYCSFTSNQFTKEKSLRYMEALKKEIDAVKVIFEKNGLYAESIYFGGGTPTSLEAEEFELLLKWTKAAFYTEKTREWTVEAGRPDTITLRKLELIKNYGVDRISINPQSMKQHTLDLIGRSHSPQQIREAFKAAKSIGISTINADLITGLPEENLGDFKSSLDEIIELGANNITVHTLAVKKASRLIDEDPDLGRRQADTVRQMLEYSRAALKEKGFRPYYLYRQKQMAGNFENVGYAEKGLENVYNIRIMDENQSNIALGAGGISKIYYPQENRLERIPNVSNYEIYIDRINDMIERKETGIL